MKVALVASALETLGGMEMVMLRTARYLAQSGRHPVLVGRDFHRDLAATCEAEGLEMRRFAGPANPSRIRSVEAAARELERVLVDCDVINPHNFPAAVWVHAARGGLSGSRLFYSCHEPPRHLYERVMDSHFVRSRACSRSWITREFDAIVGSRWRRLDRQAMLGYDVVLTNSTYTARKIREIYGREAVAAWFGAPVPGDRACGAGADAETPGAAGALRVLSVSRLTPMKNVSAGVEAVARLGVDAGVDLRVVGEGDRREDLARRVAEAGTGARVHFLGALSEADLDAEYREADALLYVPYDEPMGLVPMEAALRGVPCVVSDHGGPAEIFVPGESALLVDPDCPQEIADALLRLRDDPGLRLRLAGSARRRVEALSFSHYAAILERVLQGRSPTAP